MKRTILLLMIFAAAIMFFSCSENNSTAPGLIQGDQVENSLAKKPAPSITGILFGTFTPTPPTFWNGTIDFGDEVGEYGITFVSHEGEKTRTNAQSSKFYEDIYIYYLGTDWTVPENVVAIAWNYGTVTHANKRPDEPSKAVANGKIEEAFGPLEMWEGRRTHNDVIVTWNADGSPNQALGTIRIN
jgi:hypothetical protein